MVTSQWCRGETAERQAKSHPPRGGDHMASPASKGKDRVENPEGKASLQKASQGEGNGRLDPVWYLA